MKIKLKDLKPNPFKCQINEGILNGEKIEKLKESIGKDGFWSGVMCRKTKSGYEIPYGHHRVASAIEVLGKDYEVDIPVKDFSDEQMVRMLANENSYKDEEYAIYQIDTVVMVGEWLDKEKIFVSGKNISKTKPFEYDSAENISCFLGKKNWSTEKVTDYLRMAKDLNNDLKSEMKNAPNTGKASEFSVSHAKAIIRLPKPTQEKLYKEVQTANKLLKDRDGFPVTKREMNEIVTSVERGNSPKEAVNKIVYDRDGKQKIKESLKPFEGQRLLILCNELSLAIDSNQISSYPEKAQDILRVSYEKLITKLNQEIERAK